MEHQLNNPLRPNVKTIKTEPAKAEVPPPAPHKSATFVKEPTPPPAAREIPSQSLQRPLNPKPQESSQTQLSPEVKRALDSLNASEDLRKLMSQLAESGLEISGPKKNYVKHSYEIEEDLHKRFHEMYPVLGFRKVKDAINDAISAWCEQNAIEFKRRNGAGK